MSVDAAESTLEQAGFNPIHGGTADSGNPAGTVAYTEPVRRVDGPRGLGRHDLRVQRASPPDRRHEATATATAATGGNGGRGNGHGGHGGGTAAAAEPPAAAQAPSWRRTSAATAPPSARPFTCGCTTPITLPIAFMPSPAAPTWATAAVTRSAISCVAELRRQVVGDHGRLGDLLGGHLRAAAVGERGRGLAPLLGLGGEHADDVVVAELAGLLAGHLGVGDRGEDHPQRRGAHLVAGLDRGGEVGAQTVLEVAHARHCGSLARVTLPRRRPPYRCCRRRSAPGPLAGAALTAYAAGEARAYTLRRVTVPVLPPGQPGAAGAAPQRRAHDARPEPQAGVAARPGRPAAGPGRQHRRQPRAPRLGARSCCDCLGDAARRARASSSSAPTTTSRPTLRNPLRYLLPDDGTRHTDTPQLPWRDLRDGLHRRRLGST